MVSSIDIERKQMSWQGNRLSWFEGGQGPSMIFLHGGGGTGRAWWAQLQHFATRFRVIAPDLPGFGQSDWVSGVESVDAIAPVFLEWMAEALNVGPMVLVGNSMGGRVALSAASHQPERVRALILLAAVGVTLPDVPIQNPLSLPPERFAEGLVYDPIQFRKTTPYRTLDDAQELHRGRQSFARYLSEAPIGPDPQLNLQHIAMPSLLIWGRHDHIIPVPYGQALHGALPHAELVIFEDCGHLPHIEVPHLTNQVIDNFLDREYPG